MSHTKAKRHADPVPWFKAWPGVEQRLTLGMSSRELALWFTLRLGFWAAGCIPLSREHIERAARLQGMLDHSVDTSVWWDKVLTEERGIAEAECGGWVFPDLLQQHEGTVESRKIAAENGSRGGKARGKKTPEPSPSSASAPESSQGDEDPDDF